MTSFAFFCFRHPRKRGDIDLGLSVILRCPGSNSSVAHDPLSRSCGQGHNGAKLNFFVWALAPASLHASFAHDSRVSQDLFQRSCDQGHNGAKYLNESIFTEKIAFDINLEVGDLNY